MEGLIKRVLDVLVSSLVLLFFSPALAVLAIAIRLDSRGSILFTPKRLGLHGRQFTMFKFRTMFKDARPVRNPDGSFHIAQGDPRVTRVGRWLREYSLDEVPQLWNVLRGEMSLVGPRPDEASALAFYDDVFRAKLGAKPGLTSLPAVRGRNLLPWRTRAKLDRYYVQHQSLLLDLKIILLTVPIVFKRQGIYTTPRTPASISANDIKGEI
ncbi:MAG: sugar transferase [Acidobacteriota bacterium]|nr:sugar transferase [Acidobacteriota bacterium]